MRECLESIARQDFPAEVLVVDDGGDLESPPGVTVLHQERAGPARARNRGAQATEAEVLVFLDDDCRLGPGWLKAAASRLQGQPDLAVGGRLVNAFPENPWAETSQLIVDYLYEVLNADPERAVFLGSGHLAVPAAAFREVGGFCPAYPRAAAEDRDFCRRWLASGRRLAYLPEVAVHHAHALTWRGFLRQHWAYGRGARRFHAGGTKAQAPGFYGGLLRYPWRRYPAGQACSLGWRLLVSQVAHTLGYLWQGLQDGLGQRPVAGGGRMGIALETLDP